MNDWTEIQRWLVPISFVALYIAEVIWPERAYKNMFRHNSFNLLVGLGNMVWIAFAGVAFQRWFTHIELKQWGLFNAWGWDGPFLMVAEILIIDVFMYGWHRINHEWSFLWRWHRLHHTDLQMNTTTAIRFHTVELLFSYPARWLPFTLLGISTQAIALHGMLLFPVILWHHSNLSSENAISRGLSWLLVGPSMHRIHHSNRVNETNSNYSSLFPWWDGLFGTRVEANQQEVVFGVEDVT